MTTARDPDRDQALMARVTNGDVKAMRALYESHSEAVWRFVRSRLRDEFEANDIVHETMLTVWRTAERYQGRASLRSWMLSIARNKIVDHLRKHGRVDLREADTTVPDDTPNAEIIVAAAQDAARLRVCIEKLGQHQRAAIHLAYFEELTYDEIATVEQVPAGTVKSRIFHAKQLLMRCLTRGAK
ncbi:sigma-70 family RNA polymerase sigma factor [Shimia sp. R10_1]|uniref:RNA polymerase sigma factor n=1 Tax=Shimia sp. R10_1 TaxID=2821095 RepID=UPI001ADACDE8|nr:sigma-70 family RNA polymerase sigma factor [Shimia sp. R10_1]MBO9472181.1 sigma-70 family RNA polymerase sigma factor [Shimia sp. R10_1]